jgi:hypothetical protein
MSQQQRVELEIAAIRKLFEEWKSENYNRFRDAMRSPAIELSDMEGHLGEWSPQRRCIRFSRSFVFSQPWGVVIEVLKHEMAHQYAHEVLNATDETAHGKAFQWVCERFGVDATASGLPASAQPDDAESRILERISRLLALAESPNEHEARAAASAAQRLMLKYNLDVRESATRRGYNFRHLGEPSGRVQAHERELANILSEHFFVEVIWVPSYRASDAKSGSVIEVCGTSANLEMASYVHAFLLQTGERLWREHQRAKNIRSDRDRRTFLVGVMQGFAETLRAQAKQNTEQGMVWVKDADLHDYFRERFPRVRTVYAQGPRATEAIQHGREAGRGIVLNRPIQQGSSGGAPKALPPKRLTSRRGRGRRSEQLDLRDHDVVVRAIASVARRVADVVHDILTHDDAAEDRVAVVEVADRLVGDEPLRPVGAGAGVGHREDTWAVVAKRGVELIAELVTRAASAPAVRVLQ